MSQVLGQSNKCEHGFYPRIVCDICFPPLIKEYLAGDDTDICASDEYINCEMHGEPMAGVRHIKTGIDHRGDALIRAFAKEWINKTFGLQECTGRAAAARVRRWLKQNKRKSKRGYG